MSCTEMNQRTTRLTEIAKECGPLAAILLQEMSENAERRILNGEEWLYGPQEWFAKKLGVAPSTIKRATKKLFECGAISKEKLLKNKLYQGNFYQINNF